MTVYRNEEVLQSEVWPSLIDTHCHLDLEPLSTHLDEVLASARKVGVTQFVVPGVHPNGWRNIVDLVATQTGIFPAYGIHPMHAGTVDECTLGQLELLADEGVAIGEIGIDPAYDVSLEQQECAFREQVRLAVSLGLPVLIHCRQAFQRTLRVLQEENASRIGGIMHAFSGSVEMAREFIRLGFVISISGVLTRDSAFKPHRLVRELPLESLVLETDSPDLTPQRYRGQWNQPAYMIETLLQVARIKSIDPREVASICRNASLRVLPRLQ